MADAPWLTIVGFGEDGLEGLTGASRSALETAEIIMAPPRHLALLPDGLGAERVAWPVPYATGLEVLDSLRGRSVVVLASGDPFWFGAGSVLAHRYAADEWVALPGASVFSLVAARLGWSLEQTGCFGLHAAPLSRLRPHLTPGARQIVLLRDGAAVASLAGYLTDQGFGASTLHVFEAVGGPGERHRQVTAQMLPDVQFAHPVCVAVQPSGDGAPMTWASGRDDGLFDSDGTMTKRPVRALTLSALAPRPYEHLWDIGGGSGSIAIEWLLSHPTLRATCIEPRADRVTRIVSNAKRLGVDHLKVVEGSAPDALADLDLPQAVFVGGGLSGALLDHLRSTLPGGTRIVANAVTLETEALLIAAQARLGGDLLRIELAQSTPLGPRRGWQARYPIVQWSHIL